MSMNDDTRRAKHPGQRTSWILVQLCAGLLVALGTMASDGSYEQRMKASDAAEQDFAERNEWIIHYRGSSSIRHSEERSYGKAEDRLERESQERRSAAEAAPRTFGEAEERRVGGADERSAGTASQRGSIRHDSR